MKNYIIKDYDKNRFLAEIFKLRGHDYLIDEDILSLDSFKKKYLAKVDIFDIYKVIKDKPLSQFEALKDDIDFLKEISQIHEDIEAYDVDIDDLDIHDELKEILRMLPKLNYQNLYKYIDNKDLSDYTIYDSSYSHLDRSIIKRMMNSGAKLVSDNYDDHLDIRYEMISERQEIEAAIQYIINNDIDPNDVAFISLNSNQKLMRSIFYRYKIPHHFLHDERINHHAHKLVSLLDFYLKQDLNSYLNVIKNSIFAYNNEEIITYLNEHIDERADIFQDFASFINENNYYRSLEEDANKIHLATYPKLKELLKAESFKEALIAAFRFIDDAGEEALGLKKFIEENDKNLYVENYFILRDKLMNMHIKKDGNGIVVANLFDGVTRPYIFVFDATQDKYPAFSSLKGLFNEKAILRSSYPSLNERYEYHKERLAYLKNSYRTFFAIATSNYQGKANEISSDIEAYDKIDLPLIEHNGNFNLRHELSSELAKKVFFDKSILRSSVSALERYQTCHYAYFLNYGLGLYEPYTFKPDPASVGTIIHSLFEKLITIYNKDYTSVKLDEVKKIIDPFIRRFDLLYPKYRYRHAVIKDRILNSFMLELRYLDKLEKNTLFVPSEQEYRFDTFIVENKVSLKGSIDRIDKYDGHFRVLDYKTSDHSLKKAEISKGLSLQLLTYSLVYEKLDGAKAVGSYYLNVNHPRFSIDDCHYSLKNGLTFDDKDIILEFDNRHKLKGMTLEEIDALDLDHSHILSRSKKNISKDYKLNHDEVAKAFKTIYENIYDNMKDGNIALEPVDGACNYCPYLRICHYKGGLYYDRDIIYDLRNEKEDE